MSKIGEIKIYLVRRETDKRTYWNCLNNKNTNGVYTNGEDKTNRVHAKEKEENKSFYIIINFGYKTRMPKNCQC